MNRILLSLVSYFVCLLFFTTQSKAATFTVTSTTNDPNAVNGLGWAITQANGAGVGPHTILLTVDGATWGVGVTLSNSNVTLMAAPSGCDATQVINMGGANLTISGSNCVISGIIFRGTSLVLTGSNNRVWGCWFNTDATGLASNGVGTNNGSMIYINGGANNTIGMTGQCHNVFSGASTADMIRVDGTATGTIISNNYMGVGKDGTTALSAASQNGVNFVSGSLTSSRIDSNIIASTAADGIKIGGDFSNSFIRRNTIRQSSAGNGILGVVGATLSGAAISNNTINSNFGYGIYVLGTANNLQITNNNIGATSASLAGTNLGNKGAGIKFEGNTNSLTITGNVVLDNGFDPGLKDQASSSGIYVYANGKTMSNVTVSNNRCGVDINSTKKGNSFSGIYFESSGGSISSIIVSGNIVGDNGLNPNGIVYGTQTQKSHGISFLNIGPGTSANVQILNNYVGVTPPTDPVPNGDVGNYGNGMELYTVSGFTVTGNVVGFNKFVTTRTAWTGGGIMINGGSTTGIVRGNYIGVTSTGVNIGNANPGNSTYPNQMAGITVQASTNITIGGTTAGQANTIRNNNWGIQLVNAGATLASSNTILGNTISNQTAYGIYIPGGSGNTIGDGTAAGANIISTNGSDGIFVLNTTSVNNKITRNQIFCNTGQGIKLNYGASQGNNGQQPPVITSISGNTVSGTATAGATVEIFIDDPSCQIACGSATSDNRREGKTYLTTVTATGGTWTYTHGSAIDANNVSATATVGSNTSEFSTCNIVTICPPDADAEANKSICNSTTTTLTSNKTAVELAGGTATWTATATSGTGTITAPLTGSPVTVTGLTVGQSSTFELTVTKVGCPASKDYVTVTVVASVTPTANATQTSVCSTSQVVNLSATPSNGTWTANGGTATFSPNATTAGATATITSGTSVSFTWTVSNAPCSNTATTSAVTVVSSVTPTANATQTSVCSTSALVNLSATPSNGTWTANGGTATFSPNATTAGATATITSGTSVSFTWTVSNAPCSNTATTSAVTVVSSVTPTANATQTSVCSTSQVVNLSATPSNGSWTANGGTATYSPNSTTAGATATITSGTSVSFTWTVSNAPCSNTATTSAVTVVSSVTPTANATQTSVCSTSKVVNLSATPSNGTWTANGGTATFSPNATTAGATATITSGTSVSFTWTVSNAPCSNTATTSAVTVVSSVTPTANATQTSVCSTSQLVNLSATPSNGTWTANGGTATFSPNATTAGATATITSGTSVSFTWTVSNAPCSNTATTSAVTVVSSVTPTANATQTSVCSTSQVVNLSATPSNGSWTANGGTATFSPNATTAGATATITSGTSVSFTWTVSNAPCSNTATTSAVTVVSSVTPTANATQTSVCSTSQLVNLSATPSNGSWTANGGTATFSPNATTAGATATITSGTSVSFTWTVSNAPCSNTATTSAVTVVSSVTPTANATQTSVCSTSALVNLSATPSNGTWTANGGTATFSPNATTAGATATITSGTSVSFTWTVNNAPCNNTATTSAVSVISPTSVNALANSASVCSTNPSVTLSGSPVGGTWTVLTGTGAATFLPNATTASVNATITSGTAVRFIWTVSNGSCSGADTTNAVVVDTPVPANVSADPTTVCNSTTGTLVADDPSPATGLWTKLSGTGNIVAGETTLSTTHVENLTVGGTTQFIWTVTSGACITKDTVDVVSIDPGAPSDAGDDTLFVCNNDQVALQAVGAGSWSIPIPNTNPSTTTFAPDAVHASTTVNGLSAGTYSFVWTITSVVGCPSTSTSTDTVKVIVRSVDAPIIDGDTTAVCLTKDYNYNVTNFNALNSYLWTTSTSNLAIQGANNGSAVIVEANGSGTVTVKATAPGTGPACSVSASINLNLLPNLPIGDTTRLATCIFTNFNIRTNVFDTTYFDGTWSSSNGAITFTYHPEDSTTTINGLVDGVNDTLIYTVSSLCDDVDFVYILKVGGYFTDLEASGPSDTLCVTKSRNLNALVSPAGNYTYYWVSNLDYNNPVINSSAHVDSTTVPTYSITPRGSNNVYLVYVVDKASQCRTDIDTAYIHAVEGQDLNVPNLITPNDDNMNDHWVLKDKATGHDILPGSHFELYNRWGQRVFVMDDYDNRFKADHISDGVYYFNVKSGCGDKEYKGWLQILGNNNP